MKKKQHCQSIEGYNLQCIGTPFSADEGILTPNKLKYVGFSNMIDCYNSIILKMYHIIFKNNKECLIEIEVKKVIYKSHMIVSIVFVYGSAI
jgi:hypothetical protein